MSPAKSPEERTVSRRRLLRILAATGGAIAASGVLPARWTKPVVEVGVIPAHAQVTRPMPTAISTVYAMVCDSTPGGGDITGASDYCIDNVAAIVSLLSGSGPVAGLTVTVTCSNPIINFTPALPQTAVTDASGRADFGSLCIVMDNNITDGMQFSLLFSCTDPVNGGTLNCTCGIYNILLG
jgi:hypothetical protein